MDERGALSFAPKIAARILLTPFRHFTRDALRACFDGLLWFLLNSRTFAGNSPHKLEHLIGEVPHIVGDFGFFEIVFAKPRGPYRT